MLFTLLSDSELEMIRAYDKVKADRNAGEIIEYLG